MEVDTPMLQKANYRQALFGVEGKKALLLLISSVIFSTVLWTLPETTWLITLPGSLTLLTILLATAVYHAYENHGLFINVLFVFIPIFVIFYSGIGVGTVGQPVPDAYPYTGIGYGLLISGVLGSLSFVLGLLIKRRY